MFDLATVYNSNREYLLKNSESFADKLPLLIKQVNYLEQSEMLEKRLQTMVILLGGEKIRGKEMTLFRDFIASVERTINIVHVNGEINDVEPLPAQPDRVYSGEIISFQDDSAIQETSPGVAVEHRGIASAMCQDDIGKSFSISYDGQGNVQVKELGAERGNEIDR